MAAQASAPRIGLLVNPIAGMGGRVALKGTDGPDALTLARRLGATPVAPGRTSRALRRLATALPDAVLVAGPEAMGADVARASGLPVRPLSLPAPEPTSAADTQACARALADEGVDLLLFAGGDGTARDIVEAIGSRLPIVGIPTGVKMHSGVFAATPDAAGRAAAAYLRAPGGGAVDEAEVADVDEAAARAGRASTRLYGLARVPRQPALMVGAKSSSPPRADRALDALCQELATSIAPGATVILGPGTTTARVLEHLGLSGTLLGVDAVRDGALVGRDLGEEELLALLADAPDARLLLGVIGGQGSLLGRGNQQLSPRVLRRIGGERIEIAAAADKLVALQPPVLRIDTGDEALDAELSGRRRVRTGPNTIMIMPVSS
jgi:predicted polyphosphate/ATP-dependent NAD kinase